MRINRIKLVSEMARKNMNIKELAHRTGLSRGTISLIKNGKSCSLESAAKLAEALCVNLSSLLEEQEMVQ